MAKYILLAFLTAILACKQQKTIKPYIAGTDRIGFLVSGDWYLNVNNNLQRDKSRIYKYAEDGTVDTSFGKHGYITPESDVPRASFTETYAIDRDGNIYVTGRYSDGKDGAIILLKYTPCGMPDRSFGKGGKVVLSASYSSMERIIVTIDADDRPVVLGSIQSITSDTRSYHEPKIHRTVFAVWRFCKTGLPDTTFAQTGYVMYEPKPDDRDSHPGTALLTNRKNEIFVLASFQSYGQAIWKYSCDGKLMIGAWQPHGPVADISLDKKDRLLVSGDRTERYLPETCPDGSLRLDTTFGFKYFKPCFGGIENSDANNRLYLLGGSWSKRFLEDGFPDLSFTGADCIVEKIVTKFCMNFGPQFVKVLNKNNLICRAYVKDLQDGSPMRALFFETYDEQACSRSVGSVFGKEDAGIFKEIVGKDIVVTQDNGFLIAGSLKSVGAAIFKYTADNRLDVTFGHSGYIANIHEGVFDHIAVGQDGSIYSGNAERLYKYTPAGTPDASFGTAGIILPVRVPEYYSATISDLVVNDHNIIVTGYVRNPHNLFYLVIGRYTLDGTPDSTFGVNGIVSLEDPRDTGRTSAASKVTFDKNSNLLVAGRFSNNIALWRFKKNGTLDTAFGGSGYVILKDRPVRVEERNDFEDVAIDNQGRILISGAYEIKVEMMSVKRMVVARYFPNGKLDTTFGEHGFAYSRYDDESLENRTQIMVGPDGTIFFAYNGMTIWRYDRNGRPDSAASDSGFVDFGMAFEGDKDTPANVNKLAVRGKDIIVLGKVERDRKHCMTLLWLLPNALKR